MKQYNTKKGLLFRTILEVSKMARILVIDDEEMIRFSIQKNSGRRQASSRRGGRWCGRN
jgi:hypothetical protein